MKIVLKNWQISVFLVTETGLDLLSQYAANILKVLLSESIRLVLERNIFKVNEFFP
jgi:hypothetical protein